MITLKKRIRKQFKPLEWSLSLVVKGGSTEQQHDADNNIYYPDRGLTSTLIEPQFSITDRDSILPSGNANNSLINISWKQVIAGRESGCNTPDYELITNGTDALRKGSIIVSKNVLPTTPVVLLFSAEYYDSRTQETIKLSERITLNTLSVATLLMYTKLDKPSAVHCNPFEMVTSPLEVVKPIFQLGDSLLTDMSKVGAWWYKFENGVERLMSVVDDLELESIGSDKTLIIRKRYIRDTLFRLKTAFFPDGRIPASPPAHCNINDVRFLRKYPAGCHFEMVLSGQGEVSANATSCLGKVVATLKGGVVADPDQYWMCLWLLRKAGAGNSYTQVADGFGPVKLPVGSENLSDVQVTIVEKGPLAAITCDGKLLTHNGAIVVTQLPE